MACRCSGKPKEKRANWRVQDRECNYSAFNGYQKTFSDYSKLFCMLCGGFWRSKAAYVDDIEDGDARVDL